MNSDFRDLLLAFKSFQVEYLVIGGYAVIYYDEPRYTKDIELWVRAEKANAERVYAALKDFGAPIASVTADDFAHEGYFYQIGVPPTRIDILMSVAGVSFDDAWPRRIVENFEGVDMYYVSRADLIAMKKTAGRPQDLIDVAALEKK